MKVDDLKRGGVIEHNGKTWVVRDVDKSAPTSRGGTWVYRFKLDSVPPGSKTDLSARGGDDVTEAELSRRVVEFSYKDGDNFVFMDTVDYTQFVLSPEQAGDFELFAAGPMENLQILIVNDEAVGLQLPLTVELDVVDTPPYMKGASATGRGKTARLSTGLEVQVPEYIENGTRVKVNTETHEYTGRA
jgi:elongation factor P